jgi:hypothetical protein
MTAPSALSSDAGSDAGDAGHCDGYQQGVKKVYWGNLHQHTAYSADAYLFGTRATPTDAYAYAKGGKPQPGNQKPQLAPGRTLDFLAVTDHSEWLAYTQGCGFDAHGNPLYLGDAGADPLAADSTECKQMQDRGGLATLSTVKSEAPTFCQAPTASNPAYHGVCAPLTRSGWKGEQDAANAANDSCKFTAFIAYEWTHQGSSDETLHKNVIFKDENVPPLPFDAYSYPLATSLWTNLDTGCTSANGCEAITIPHNSNLSDGHAFDIPTTDAGVAAQADIIRQMHQYQRLVEIHQEKGNSECSSEFDPDPNCNFETAYAGSRSKPDGYVRAGLSAGLDQYPIWNLNPLRMGISASMDDHHSSPGQVDPQAYAAWSAVRTPDVLTNPGGLTGVWAEENTREAIFDAFVRRETFATSGPRIQVAFYQVWSDKDFCAAGGSAVRANILNAGGMVMGRLMPPRPAGVTGGPWFIVQALMDQTPLDAVDFVKGVGGNVPAEVTSPPLNSTSAPCVRWQDTKYVDSQPAYYYARVREAKTWRWSHYLPTPPPDDVKIQQRAWSSPIWRVQ